MKAFIAAAAVVALCLPGAARADGPFFNDAGGLHGILAPSGYRYVTIGERHVVILVRVHRISTLPRSDRYPAITRSRL
jgi:hypothetical protein